MYTKNKAIHIAYRALNYVTGLTDVSAKVYDEIGGLFTTITLTEVVGQGGLYIGTFTPDEAGQWRIRISSITNLDDVTKVFEVGLYDTDDIKVQTQSIEDKIDIIDGNIDLIKLETDKIQTIDDNVDSIKTTVESTALDVTAIKTKTDNLPADTEQSLVDIKTVVDNINTSISRGGYFCN